MEETAVKPTDSGSLVAQRMNLLPQNFDQLKEFGKMMFEGKMMPPHLKSAEACTLVALQALQWGLNPIPVAQKTFEIKGKLGYEAQLIMAVINTSGVLKTPFEFQWNGAWEKVQGKIEQKTSSKNKDDEGEFKKYYVPAWKSEDEKGLSCTVKAALKRDGVAHSLTIEMTQATIRNSTLWASDPKQQLAYLTVKRWAALHCPEVILGFVSEDDVVERGEPINGGEVTPEPVQKPALFPLGDDLPEEETPETPKESESVLTEIIMSEEDKKALWVLAKENGAKTKDDVISFAMTALGYPAGAEFKLEEMTAAQFAEVKKFYQEQG